MPPCCSRVAAVGFALLLAGCSLPPVSRVVEDLTKASLAQERMGVALLTAAVEGEACRQSGLVLGVREKDGFRVYTGVMFRRAEAPIAEVKLAPGEYHIVGFTCENRGHRARLSELGYDDGRRPFYRRSYARFTVQPGEIVNVGFLKVGRIGQSPIAIDVDLAVTDWPVADKERFEEQRPGLHAQMKTRLMLLTPPVPVGVQCAQMLKYHAESFIQSLPDCQPGVRPKAPGKGGKDGAAT